MHDIINKVDKERKMKTVITEIKMELQKTNAKLSELQWEMRTNDDKMQCERKLIDSHRYIEALW